MSSAQKSIFILALLLFTACGKRSGFQSSFVPQEQAKLQDIIEIQESSNPVIESNEDLPPDQVLPAPDVQEPDWQEPPVENPTGSKNETPPVDSDFGQRVLVEGKWVIDHESKKMTTACNFYVQRVLQRLEFKPGEWLANDFDSYLKEQSISAKKKSFVGGTVSAQRENLKKYLWSFPQRTGFIFQWKRPKGHGHIGIVHRIGDQLVIYHANLGRFRPKAQAIDLETLIYPSGRQNSYVLNVFSDLQLSPDQRKNYKMTSK